MRRYLATPDGQVAPTSFINIDGADLPSNFLRSNATNTLTGDLVLTGAFNVTIGHPISGTLTGINAYVTGKGFTINSSGIDLTPGGTFNNGMFLYKTGGVLAGFPMGSSGQFLQTNGTTASWITNIPITNLNGGSGASSSTFWRGDGTWATPSVAATSWGSITGTLSDQTDLQNALNAKQATIAGATGIASLGTGLQMIRVNSGATALEYFSPLSNPSSVTYDINYWNAGTQAFNALSLGSSGFLLGNVGGALAYSDPTLRFWNVGGTTTLTSANTIAQAGFALGFTATQAFSGSHVTVQNVTNNGSEIFNISSLGRGLHRGYNSSGTEIGQTSIAVNANGPNIRLQNPAGTTGYDMNYHVSNAAYNLYNITVTSTKVGIGGGNTFVPAGTLHVLGGTTGGSNVLARFGDASNNGRWALLDNGNLSGSQHTQSATNTYHAFTQAAHTGGQPVLFSYTGGAHTTMLNGGSIAEASINLARTIQWNGNNAVTSYRGLYIQSPTLAATNSGQVVTTASTLSISGAPVSGTNNTITNAYALNIEAGNSFSAGKIVYDQTITAGGTTGNQTINKPSGTVNIAAVGTAVTVTNSLVTTSSTIFAVLRTNDGTATIKNVVPGAGSFVINLGAAATAEVSIGFLVIN